MTTNKGFLASLFDFSFSNFITPRIVGLIYGLSILGVLLALMVGMIAGLTVMFQENFVSGLFTVIITPLAATVYLLFIRVGLEALTAGIVTAKNTTEIREYVRQIRNENNENGG